MKILGVNIVKVRYLLWILLFLETLVLIRNLDATINPFKSEWSRNRLIQQQFNGDEPSYFMFNFSSLHTVLDNYRSLGLPLFIRFYNLFYHGYQFWPFYLFAIYIASIFFLFWALLKFGFDEIVSFIFVSALLGNIETSYGLPWFHLYKNLAYIASEVPSVAFMYISLGFMLLAIRYKNLFIYLVYALSLFFLYQIRPNLTYIAILAPFWAVALYLAQKTFTTSNLKRVFWYFVLTSWVPLLLFGLLRFAVLGQFGFATMTGGTLSGHAVHYLNENNVKKLSGESRLIGEEILRRKRKLTPPCNMTPIPYGRADVEAECFGPNLMVAWQVVIKYQTGKEPLDDPQKNIEAWKHVVTLAPFHMTYYHVSTDKILMRFTSNILRVEWSRYFQWIIDGGMYGLRFLLSDQAMNVFYKLCLLLAVAVQFIIRKEPLNRLQIKRWQRQILAITFVALSNFIVGYILLLLFNYPFDRMFVTITPYMIPALVLWVIPPFWSPSL